MNEARGPRPLPPAGLCASCRHAERLASPRALFLRCALARRDPRFPRYPSLPVLACAGHEPAAGDGAGVS
jgi:hypothetical protein